MANEAAIRFLELTKVYRDGLTLKGKLSVSNLSFTVPRGKIFGFLGANGAGKTTSIKIALGLQSATSGRVEIFGEDATLVANRARLGYLPERPYFQMNFTADETLNFHRSLYGKKHSGKNCLSNQELLKLVGLEDSRYTYLRSFSKGMLQRIGIAQSLVNDPELVILDEPMSGLDPVGRRDVRNLILDLNRSGKTIFFSSHILSDIESLCEEIAFLEKGVLKYLGKVDQVIRGEKNEYEITFRLENPAEIGLTFQNAGQYYRATVQGNKEARVAAERIWQKNGEVISLGPVQKSLEEVLFGKE